jgi:hypothetical protein
MKSRSGLRTSFLRKTCLIALLGTSTAGAQAPAATPTPAPAAPAAQPALPAVPFEARVARETQLYRKKKLDQEDVLLTTPGHVFTVSELAPERKSQGETAPVAVVHPHVQSTYYMLLSTLQPLSPGEVVTDAEAAELLFPKSLGEQRPWCQRFTERLLLPASAGAGKGGSLIYSASSDTACAGYMALVSGVGKEAKAHSLPRLGALQSVHVREVSGSPPLLDVVESITGKGISGRRRRLLSLTRSGAKELLAVDIEVLQPKGGTQHSVQSDVSLKPSGQGLDIDVERTEQQVSLATGAVASEKKSQKRYRYTAGKLTARP